MQRNSGCGPPRSTWYHGNSGRGCSFLLVFWRVICVFLPGQLLHLILWTLNRQECSAHAKEQGRKITAPWQADSPPVLFTCCVIPSPWVSGTCTWCCLTAYGYVCGHVHMSTLHRTVTSLWRWHSPFWLPGNIDTAMTQGAEPNNQWGTEDLSLPTTKLCHHWCEIRNSFFPSQNVKWDLSPWWLNRA